MKNHFSFAALSVLLLLGCGNNNQQSDSTQAAKDSNQSKMDSSKMNGDTSAKLAASVNEADTKFAVDATDAGMTEVQLGKIAQENSSSKEVKDFGAMMVKDHTKAGDELSKIAMSKKITLPTSVSADHQKAISDLSQKKGKDFDKAYIDMMVKDHEGAVTLFEDEAKKGSDTDLREFAGRTLDVIHMHLNDAKKCKSSLK